MATTPSDLTVITRWLDSLNDDSFVAVTGPTSERYTQDEAHQDAHELIAARGLAPTTAYVVWHHQAHQRAFDRRRNLTGPLLLYFGGDRELVTAKLGGVPEGFELSGGRTDTEAFALHRKLDLRAVDAHDAGQVAEVFDRFASGHTRTLSGIRSLDEPPSDSVIAWVRTLLADTSVPPESRGDALEFLEAARAVNDTDLEVAYAARDEILRTTDGWHIAVLALIRSAWLRSWTPAAALVRELATDPELGERALIAWPDATSLAQARELRHPVAAARIRAFLESRDARAVAVEDAVAAQAAPDETSVDALAAQLATIELAPDDDCRPYRGFDLGAVLDVVRDPAIPDWLRAKVADHGERVFGRLRRDLQQPGAIWGMPREVVERHVFEWPAAVEAVRASLPDEGWRGPDVTNKYECRDTLPDVQTLTPAQAEWFHEQVKSAAARSTPLDLDAWGYLLEPLAACRLFTHADAEALLPIWRTQLVGKHDNYQNTQPALLSYALGLLQLGHPQAHEVVQAIAKLKQKWAGPLQTVLAAWQGMEDQRDLLWRQAVDESLEPQYAAIAAWIMTEARLAGVHPVYAAARLWETAQTGSVRTAYSVGQAALRLGIEFASDHPRLLNTNGKVTPEHLAWVERMAVDPHLSEDFKAALPTQVGRWD
ncbi:MAG: hypothetical protein V9G04_15085 [Nocardioides sp.]